ncbi:D-glycerate dehydrogenase [Methylibium sp.]|uniref:2-hydroxyacid dehydrogenase n=1 Tax=Methylibium sp. TaxID=2067992 RepID=UPI002DB5B15B|nr:D-glycerate dehydrogenase [Methylibium sp.]
MTTTKKLLVARAIFPDIVEALRLSAGVAEVADNPTDEVWSRDALLGRLDGCDGLFCTGSERIDAALLDACPALKAVSTMSVGTNHIDVDACSARGVLVANTPDVLTDTTADLAFALLLACARRVGEGERYLREGRWTKWHYDQLMGADVHGATLGILGMGRIGQAVARRGALGFGMRVIYHNRSRLPAEQEAPLGARWVEKAALLAEADHLVLVLPYSAATHHAIGAAELAQMKPGATLVNIARGGIVDDAALARSLAEGRIGAAGIDVFEGEPHVTPALLAAPNAVLTPHIGSASMKTRRAMAQLAADNLLAALGLGDGRHLPAIVNPQAARR